VNSRSESRRLGRRREVAQQLTQLPDPPAGGRAGELVELGLELRRAWYRAVPFNRRVNLLIAADRTALRNPAACKPVGVLGDPDIVPNYPLPPAP
jgi:hypothetical protein